MTKIVLSFLLASFFSATIFGQTDKEEIEKDFKKYFLTIEQKDNVKTLEYVYPKLFNYLPKAKMLQALNGMYTDTTIVITMDNASISNVSKIIEIDHIKYALIKYSFKMGMTILSTEEESENSDEEDFTPITLTYKALKEKYGDENVIYDKENSKIDVNVISEMYTIHAPKYNGWKFLEKKESMNPVLVKLLPKKVLKKL